MSRQDLGVRDATAVVPDLDLSFVEPVQTPPVRLERQWRGCAAEHVEFTATEGVSYQRQGPSHYLALHDLVLLDGETRVGEGETVTTRDLRGTLTFLPAGCAISGWSRPTPRRNAFTALYFDPTLLSEELEARYRSATPAPILYGRDEDLEATLRKLGRSLTRSRDDALRAESLSLVAAVEVLGLETTPPAGRLGRRQVALVRDFVEANLHHDINLSDLAAVAGLSRFHFSRAFKNATGQSPYGFVNAMRIDAAAEMLIRTETPVEIVAAAVGFNGPAPFRRAFQMRKGCSPNAFRRRGG